MSNIQYKPSLVFAVLLTISVLPQHLAAQGLMLEEVVVTATKRSVGLQDVPISLSVMSGEKIVEQGIDSLEDLSVYMPNVHISQSMGGDALFIRGIGSGENTGFEQSVGTFVDGVYFGRGQSSRSTFLDIERVEILKGPQSTLFGKNTVAGAINITTARPTQEFEAQIYVSAEPEFDAWSTTGTLSGEISDSLRARLVVKREETDGYLDNTFLRRDEAQEESSVARLTVNWMAAENVDVLLKYELGESDTLGRRNAITIATDESIAIYRTADPDFIAAFNYDKSAQPINNASMNDEFHDSEWKIFGATIEWSVGEYTVRSITAYVDYEFDSNIDADIGPLQFLARGRNEQHSQFSQEFLLSSPLGEKIEYLAGLYYQEEDLSSDRTTDAAISAIGFGTGNLDGTSVGQFQQDSLSLSTFAQVTWNATEDFRVIAGLRYSHDEKEFTKYQYMADIFTKDANTTLAFIYDETLNFLTDHSFDETGAMQCTGVDYSCVEYPDFDNERSENHVTGDLTLQWDVSDAIMTYAKVGNGYKAGGFDEDNVRGRPEVQEFEDESVVNLEFGAKMDLLDGRARLNLALFYSEFEDVQVSTFDGNSAFVVDNAAESESQGLEADGSFLLAESWRVNVGFAYLDATYSDFPNAACTNSQALAFIDAGGERINCTQDLSGQPLQFAPEYSANMSLEYTTNLGSGLEFRSSLEMLYTDEFETSGDLDANLAQDTYIKWNARIAISDVEQGWNLALVLKNITDETTTIFGGDVPLAELGFDQTYFQFIDPPRSMEIQAAYNF